MAQPEFTVQRMKEGRYVLAVMYSFGGMPGWEATAFIFRHSDPPESETPWRVTFRRPTIEPGVPWELLGDYHTKDKGVAMAKQAYVSPDPPPHLRL